MSKIDDIQNILEAFAALGRRFHMHKHRLPIFRDGTIGKAQMEVMMLLVRRSAPPTMREVAKELRITSGAVTQIIAPLLTKDFIQKQADANDKRITRLVLTRKARTLMIKMKSHYVRALTPAFASLSTGDVRSLARILSKLSLPYDTRK